MQYLKRNPAAGSMCEWKGRAEYWDLDVDGRKETQAVCRAYGRWRQVFSLLHLARHAHFDPSFSSQSCLAAGMELPKPNEVICHDQGLHSLLLLGRLLCGWRACHATTRQLLWRLDHIQGCWAVQRHSRQPVLVKLANRDMAVWR